MGKKKTKIEASPAFAGQLTTTDESERGKRMAANKEKKGKNITLLKREENVAGQVSYEIIEDQNAGLRTEADVEEWMEEKNFIGTVLAVTRRVIGKNKDGIKTRQPQQTFVIE